MAGVQRLLVEKSVETTPNTGEYSLSRAVSSPGPSVWSILPNNLSLSLSQLDVRVNSGVGVRDKLQVVQYHPAHEGHGDRGRGQSGGHSTGGIENTFYRRYREHILQAV